MNKTEELNCIKDGILENYSKFLFEIKISKYKTTYNTARVVLENSFKYIALDTNSFENLDLLLKHLIRLDELNYKSKVDRLGTWKYYILTTEHFKSRNKKYLFINNYTSEDFNKFLEVPNTSSHLGVSNNATELNNFLIGFIEKFLTAISAINDWRTRVQKEIDSLELNALKAINSSSFDKKSESINANETIDSKVNEHEQKNQHANENEAKHKKSTLNSNFYLLFAGLTLISVGLIIYYLLYSNHSDYTTHNPNSNNTRNNVPIQKSTDSNLITQNSNIKPSNDSSLKQKSNSITIEKPPNKSVKENNLRPITHSNNNIAQKPNEIKRENVEIKLANFINEVPTATDMAVLIVDKDNQMIDLLSSGIADIYRNSHSVTTTLFTDNLLSNSAYLNGLINTNTQLITSLNLPSHLKYLVLGKYSRYFVPGTEYVKIVCRASLMIRVFDCESKSVRNYPLTTSSGHEDEQHAEKGAIRNLLSDFQNRLNL